MKVAVTGGSGFLGSHIVRYFSATDFSRRTGHDILNLHDMSALEEFDLVIHLAGLLEKSPEASEQVFLTNVEGTVNVLKSMRPDSTFVFASTKDVYGGNSNAYPETPETCSTDFCGQSPLEWSKLIAERYIEFYSNLRRLKHCIFRLSTVCALPDHGTTPNFPSHFVDQINKGEPIRLPSGPSPLRDFMHIDDFSAAIDAFNESGLRRGLFNLGGGPSNAETLRGFISRLEDASELQAVVIESEAVPKPLQNRYVSDLTLIDHELGWKPRVNLDEIVTYLLGREALGS
jgi:nucleoside-diphosphate-sugar epimerase